MAITFSLVLQGIHFDEEIAQELVEKYDFDMKAIYQTVWEIKQKELVQMAADRGAFIDQSQSFNVHIPDPNFGKLTSLHFTAWRQGLKTGMYYLRTQAAADAIKFTVRCRQLQEHVCLSIVMCTEVQCARLTSYFQVDQQALARNRLSQSKAILGVSSLGKEDLKENEASVAIAPSPSLGKAVANRIVATRPALGNAPSNVEGSQTLDVDMAKEAQMAAMVCSLENKDACLSCGS